MESVRRRVIYYGRVQGVGFRATTYDLAADHAVTGFVRNRDDGTVELVVEGSADEVDHLLDAVGKRFSRHISKAEFDSPPTEGACESFEVRR